MEIEYSKRFREDTLEMTQSELANAIGVSIRTVHGWERSTRPHKPNKYAILQMGRLIELQNKKTGSR